MAHIAPITRRILGHGWTDHPLARPAVLRVMEITGPYPRALQGMHARCWIIDYEFNPYGRVGVGAPKTVWMPRQAASAHLYLPGTRYWEDTRRERGQRHSAWIDFAGADGIGLERLTAERGYARFLDPSGHLGQVLHAAAHAAHQRGDTGFWQVQGCLASAIDLLLRARHVAAETSCIEPTGVPMESRELAEQARAVMKEHLSEPIALRDLARTLHVSVSTLAHRYRKQAGEPPKATMMRLRLEQARALLLRGHSVKVAAHQLGFSDAAHLSKAFKRHLGVSPRTFLEMHAANRGSGRRW